MLFRSRHADAIARLRRAEDWSLTPAPILEQEARIDAGLGAVVPMREALERLRGCAGGRIAAMREAWMLEASLEQEGGHIGEALHAYEEAFRITGDIDALARAAQLADRLGDGRRALAAYGRLCELAPERGTCARHQALRNAPPAAETAQP